MVNYEFVWKASPSGDVVNYKLYWDKDGKIPNYSSKTYSCGNVTGINLKNVRNFPKFRGTFNVGLTSVDRFGNESDMVVGNFRFKQLSLIVRLWNWVKEKFS